MPKIFRGAEEILGVQEENLIFFVVISPLISWQLDHKSQRKKKSIFFFSFN